MKPLFNELEIDNLKELPFECYCCKKTFYVKKNRYIFEKNHPERKRLRFCSQKCNNEINNKNLHQELNCTSCNKLFKKSNSEFKKSKNGNHFCSKSCSAKHNNKLRNVDVIEKQKNTLKKTIENKKDNKIDRNCLVCNKSIKNKRKKQLLCSRSCSSTYNNNKNRDKLVKAGLKSCNIQKEKRRSKNEIYFSELCKNEFSNVLINEPIFDGWDSDIVLPDLKIAVLWNGIWHYKKIKKEHSLEQVQCRDRIKIEKIKEKSFTPYIIKDLGKHDKKFVEEIFSIP